MHLKLEQCLAKVLLVRLLIICQMVEGDILLYDVLIIWALTHKIYLVLDFSLTKLAKMLDKML